MKRQLGIVALIACMILAMVPTALCASQTVTITDSTPTVTSNLNIGDTLTINIPNFHPIENGEPNMDKSIITGSTFVPMFGSVPDSQGYFSNQILKFSLSAEVYDPLTNTESAKLIAVGPGLTTITFTFINGNTCILNVNVVKRINQNGQGQNNNRQGQNQQ